ncbi:hypothetical protein [Pseudonocardia sp. H11422]|uniref:hypothetical protein n=1 Tax=Pseudonocardia sp. H11422 TaxID=2835866 RepID=UPI00292F1DF8|nr:hypothetical protein [Pseudonocardia sp. H11422]
MYLESHDEVASNNGKTRLPTDIDRASPRSWYAKKRSTLGVALVFTAPGIPMIFQGQELLETRSWHDNVPIDWADASRWAGIVTLYRDLVALRRNARSTTRGLRTAPERVPRQRRRQSDRAPPLGRRWAG